MLYFDVALVMRQKRCEIMDACKELCRGYLPHCTTVTFSDGREEIVRAASQNWKGKNWETVRQRYYQSIKKNVADLEWGAKPSA